MENLMFQVARFFYALGYAWRYWLESYRSDYGMFWGTFWAGLFALFYVGVLITVVEIVVGLIKIIVMMPQSIFFGKENRRQIGAVRDFLRVRYLNGGEKGQAWVCHYAMYAVICPFVMPWIFATNKRTRSVSRCLEYAREEVDEEDWRELKSRDRVWARDDRMSVVDFYLARNGIVGWCSILIFIRWGLRISRKEDLEARKQAKAEYEMSRET